MKNIWSLSLIMLISWNLTFAQQSNSHEGLAQLFSEWRNFESPPSHNGAPDYRQATFVKTDQIFKNFQKDLKDIDTSGWEISEKVDWTLVWAEMNGYAFNKSVLRPWKRDPAFYKVVWTHRSDVPGHEGPINHAVIELWQYEFPLSYTAQEKFIREINTIVPFYEQAKENLTGNARDLWVTGIRDIRSQKDDLLSILDKEGVRSNKELTIPINAAIEATENLVTWLEEQSSSKNGPSGIGKENYTWYLQNVHLVPLTWEDEVMILKRELARAWSSLKLEEHRNRHLPKLVDVSTPTEYDQMADQAASSLMNFLEKEDIVTVEDYFDPALRAQLGHFVPKEKRNFFYITSHYDPRPLFSHFYHWFELAQMDLEPHESEIRRGALLYNIFDSRNEGMATAVEEMFMHAGLYDDSPRSREIVYIMIAQRAARGLGSLYAHANEMTMEEAGGIHSEYTPRGWMKTEKELLIFEQHLYLRQPGYGTSYITGKYLVEQAMGEYARKQDLAGEDFSLKDFFDRINKIGNIPIALGQWELTGQKPMK